MFPSPLRHAGFSLLEILASILVVTILIAGIAAMALRGNTESQALVWVEGARDVVRNVREAYRAKDDYSDLTYASAVSNGWVPLPLQTPGVATTGRVPWTGNWTIGPYVGAPIPQPLFMTVVFGPKDTASCIAVTNAMLTLAAEMGNVEKWAWYVPTQGTPAQVTSTCTPASNAAFTMKFGFSF